MIYLVEYDDGSKSWQPIENLVYYEKLFKAFYKNNPRLKVPKIKFVNDYGALDSHDVNPQNFVLMEDILWAISIYGDLKRLNIDFDTPVITHEDKALDVDHIVVFGVDNHCLVAFKDLTKKLVYLSDSNNEYARDSDFSSRINAKLRGSSICLISAPAAQTTAQAQLLL